MPDTVREQIIKAFIIKADPLNPGNIERVLRSEPEGVNRFISVWDGEDQAVNTEFDIDTLEFPIAMEVNWDPDTVNPSVSANALIGEVRDLMESGDTTFGGLAYGFKYASATPAYPFDGSSIVIVTFIYTVTYKTEVGDPYTVATD